MAEGELPQREEVVTALRQPGRLPFFEGRVVDVIPRDEDFLLVVHEPRLDEVVAFEYEWPDESLTSPWTGQPCEGLAEWVIEIGLALMEGFDTLARADYLSRRTDADSGYTVAEFPEILDPDFVQGDIRLQGIGPDEVSWPPDSEAPMGLRLVAGGIEVFSPDDDTKSFGEWHPEYAWGELWRRVYRRWPERFTHSPRRCC